MEESVPIRGDMFTEDREEKALMANQCRSCGRIYFPKARVCLSCFHEELETILLGRSARLFTYTTVHMSSSQFQPPYAVGFVDLPEGIRIFTPLEAVEGKPFKVGMSMVLKIGTLWKEDDKGVYGYRYAPQ